MIHALIPAAGKSSRMGRPKLSLPLGKCTVIEHVVAAIRKARIDRILVVVGPGTPELTVLASSAGAQVLELDHATSDMRGTIEHGLNWIESSWQPTEHDDFLLVPADHPTLNVEVIRRLLDMSTAPIRVPIANGKRGHPTLISWRHVPGIRSMPPGFGLNAYLRQHVDSVGEVPVAGETALFDLDTPEDYERMKGRFNEKPGDL
jgi:molybdenum cofactor cytidylyltransferase